MSVVGASASEMESTPKTALAQRNSSGAEAALTSPKRAKGRGAPRHQPRCKDAKAKGGLGRCQSPLQTQCVYEATPNRVAELPSNLRRRRTHERKAARAQKRRNRVRFYAPSSRCEDAPGPDGANAFGSKGGAAQNETRGATFLRGGGQIRPFPGRDSYAHPASRPGPHRSTAGDVVALPTCRKQGDALGRVQVCPGW